MDIGQYNKRYIPLLTIYQTIYAGSGRPKFNGSGSPSLQYTSMIVIALKIALDGQYYASSCIFIISNL